MIESLEGIAEVDADIQGQKSPNQDGDEYLGSTLEPRYIDMGGSITETSLIGIKRYRDLIIRVCNPKLGLGEITLELDGDKKKIYGVLDGIPSFPERGRDPFQKFIITWKCPNPFWLSADLTTEPLAAFVEMFELPSDYWTLEDDGDLYFEVGFEGEKRELNIIGDAEVPIEIKIKGPIKNPVIKNNTTGDFIKVNTELFKDDVMIIDTEEATVFINGENAFYLIDINSYFFKLQQGINIIEYTADTGIKEAKLELIWQERYLGV